MDREIEERMDSLALNISEIWKVLNVRKEAYILPDAAITEFAQKTAKETNMEKIEALLIEFVQEHFQFRV